MFNMLRTMCGGRKSSRWSKASKCKRLIEQVWRELKIQKTRISSITRHSKSDITQLLNNGQHQKAFARVEQLYKDLCLMSAYDQLDHFSTYVYTHLPCISKESELSTEFNEAVSSLIFAASRCGELPVLYLLQNLFKVHYGCDFVKANIELLPGNHVNNQMKEDLCINFVADEMKHKLISVIAEDDVLRFKPQHEEVSDSKAERQEQVSEFNEIPKKIKSYCSSSDCESTVTNSCESYTSSDSSSASTRIYRIAVGLENEEKTTVASISEGFDNIRETIYLDDMEEKVSTREKCGGKDEHDSLKSWNERESSGDRERKKKSAGRRLKRRPVRPRIQVHSTSTSSFLSRKDMEYAMYYGEMGERTCYGYLELNSVCDPPIRFGDPT